MKYEISEYQIGDKVKVTDSGFSYSRFVSWEKNNGLTNYTVDHLVSDGCEGEVISVAEYSTAEDKLIYGIKVSSNLDIIVGFKGLSPLEEHQIIEGITTDKCIEYLCQNTDKFNGRNADELSRIIERYNNLYKIG